MYSYTMLFCESVVTSPIFQALVCWGGSMDMANTKKLNKLSRRSDELDNMETVWTLVSHSVAAEL